MSSKGIILRAHQNIRGDRHYAQVDNPLLFRERHQNSLSIHEGGGSQFKLGIRVDNSSSFMLIKRCLGFIMNYSITGV